MRTAEYVRLGLVSPRHVILQSGRVSAQRSAFIAGEGGIGGVGQRSGSLSQKPLVVNYESMAGTERFTTTTLQY